MIEAGRLCVKIAGRDARKLGVVVDVIDDNFVLIDGNVRRKRCNIRHILPLGKKIDIKKGASHEDVAAAFKENNLEFRESEPKQAGERPKKEKVVKKKNDETSAKKKEVPAPEKPKEDKPKEKAVSDIPKEGIEKTVESETVKDKNPDR